MEFLPEELKKQLPPILTMTIADDPLVICKFVCPEFRRQWYGIKFDGHNTFFGWVNDEYYASFDFFSITELQAAHLVLGCPIELDLSFQPRRLSQVRAESK